MLKDFWEKMHVDQDMILMYMSMLVLAHIFAENKQD